MTAREIVDDLRGLFPNEAYVLSHFCRLLSGEVYDARLANGVRVVSILEFTKWLRELADALQMKAVMSPMPIRPERKRLEATCPRCGHIHEGLTECGVDLGGGRVCRCELAVPA